MIILDTNIIIYTYSGKIDIVKNLNQIAPSETIGVPIYVIQELEKISKRTGKISLAARFGLKYINILLEKKFVNIITDDICSKNYKQIDDKIICIAEKHRWIMCTNDIKMKSKAKQKGLRVISVRSDRRLDFA